jgi:hypothetical protein
MLKTEVDGVAAAHATVDGDFAGATAAETFFTAASAATSSSSVAAAAATVGDGGSGSGVYIEDMPEAEPLHQVTIDSKRDCKVE